MADSKLEPTHFSSDEVKTPNLFERAKEEIEAIIQNAEKSPHHHKETHGMRNDIDDKTPLDDVRAPNVFERAKEEVEALIQTIHPKKEPSTHGRSDEDRKEGHKEAKPNSTSDTHVETPNFTEKTKEEIEQIINHEKSPHHHYRETHGMNDDIDESTPIDEVKGPNVFERAKEEIEAIFQTILPKKKS
ncbi:DEAD-box ATP-dependent RNA helicase [Trema orientale]|uniref:DEAD-box ATP-dependent RNA helicase n=1 Tax=Trema orientale TaxID=63057 RepID=A0A2P5EFV1_TREOI|nr:DEAD-box ATP-dependent RNA helicase [Trema orientale]